ncbi:hypothetical protein FIM63_04995, partial [Helicobacter pylori]
MLYPFLKIPDHYSASDRVGKVRKIKIKKRKQWGLAKRKRSNPPPKKRKFKRNPLKESSKKKKVQKKETP